MRKLALPDEILLSIQQPARYIGGEVNMTNKEAVSYTHLGAGLRPYHLRFLISRADGMADRGSRFRERDGSFRG